MAQTEEPASHNPTQSGEIRVPAEVDQFSAPALEQKFFEQMNNGVTEVIFVFTDTLAVDAAATGVFIRALRASKEYQKTVRFEGVNHPSMIRIFDVTGIDKLLDPQERPTTDRQIHW